MEKEALASLISDAATVQASGVEAGEKVAASVFEFPAEMLKKRPAATPAAT